MGGKARQFDLRFAIRNLATSQKQGIEDTVAQDILQPTFSTLLYIFTLGCSRCFSAEMSMAAQGTYYARSKLPWSHLKTCPWLVSRTGQDRRRPTIIRSENRGALTPRNNTDRGRLDVVFICS